MSLGLHPSFISNTATKLWKISDDIWHHSGDKSTDVNFIFKFYNKIFIYFI